MTGAASPTRPTVLICAATRDELETFGLDDATAAADGVWTAPRAVLAVTGVGIPHTLLRLPPLLARYKPRAVVNLGIAGAYAGSDLELGDVVLGTSETFADLGMELPDGAGFAPLGAFPFADEALRAPLALATPAWTDGAKGLKRGRGATVNACTGTDATGARRRALFEADFESMEGAAAALAARTHGDLPCVEIRAISNMAARRDMTPAGLRRAFDALAAFCAAHREAILAETP